MLRRQLRRLVLAITVGAMSCSGSPTGAVLDSGGSTDGSSAPMADRDHSVDQGGDGAPSPSPDAQLTDGSVLDAAHSPDAKVKPDAGSSAVRLLDPTVVSQIVEPEGSGKDDAGASYTDKNYWNFCAPGATAAALYYFKPTNVTAWPTGTFKEPKNAPSTIPASGTTWKSDEKVNGYHTYGRAYLMYLAMKVKPPNFGSPGMIPFDGYPTSGATQGDVRDTLNWEASGHAAGWSTFHYKLVGTSGLTAAKLHGDIVTDIKGGHAIVVAVDTIHLPNWSRSVKHSIAVIGYDDTKKTYTFVDTCGVKCNGSSKAKNGGTWAISQADLLTAIKGAGLGYIW